MLIYYKWPTFREIIPTEDFVCKRVSTCVQRMRKVSWGIGYSETIFDQILQVRSFPVWFSLFAIRRLFTAIEISCLCACAGSCQGKYTHLQIYFVLASVSKRPI